MGGVEILSDAICNVLSKAGADVVILTRQHIEGKKYENQTCPVVRVSSWLRGIRIIIRADLIIMMGPILIPLLLGNLLCKKIILTHHVPPRPASPACWKRLLSSALVRSSIQIAGSRSLAATLPGPAEVIPNPLRIDFHIWPPANRGRSILFVGRLIPEKGATVLLRAFALIPRSACPPNLTIVGSGPQKIELENLARNLGIAERVRFLASISGSELQEIYRANTVVAVPSVWEEPFGLVALEAVASGCRVVVSNRGGLPEAAGPTAIIVPPTPEAFAKGLARALDDAQYPLTDTERCLLREHLLRHEPATFVRTLLGRAMQKWPRLNRKMDRLVIVSGRQA